MSVKPIRFSWRAMRMNRGDDDNETPSPQEAKSPRCTKRFTNFACGSEQRFLHCRFGKVPVYLGCFGEGKLLRSIEESCPFLRETSAKPLSQKKAACVALRNSKRVSPSCTGTYSTRFTPVLATFRVHEGNFTPPWLSTKNVQAAKHSYSLHALSELVIAGA